MSKVAGLLCTNTKLFAYILVFNVQNVSKVLSFFKMCLILKFRYEGEIFVMLSVTIDCIIALQVNMVLSKRFIIFVDIYYFVTHACGIYCFKDLYLIA